jgi:hypothetical protein
MSDVVVTVAESTTDVNVTESAVNVDITETSVQVIAASEEVVVAQVQVDWEEATTTSFAYIKNKPDFTDNTSFTVAGGTTGNQPTFSGSPLFTGSYVKIGSQVHFQIQVEFDNITSFGTGQYYLDLPFTSKYSYQFSSGCLHDVSTGIEYPIFAHVTAGSNRVYLQSIDSQGNSSYQVDFTYNNPITLTVADNFHVSGNYITEE